MRLIDADALLKRIKKDPLFPLVEQYGISGVIKAEPTVDAEPVKHGHWIKYYETDNGRCLRCSKCQCLMVFIVGDGREDNYCPNCGAKMDEVEE